MFFQGKLCGGVLTQCGKYSAGPLCNHMMVESVGAFCTFAPGTDAVENHPIQYISTHFFMYGGTEKSEFEFFPCYDDWERINPAYFDGITPKGKVHKFSRSVIGNDVWLGKNVIITNGANIGNGVIAAAGAIITKDVPDYAIVAGVPAKIIRYRYTQEQINKLNAIAWWNWSDDKIRKCYDDFFENVDIFIQKHK